MIQFLQYALILSICLNALLVGLVAVVLWPIAQGWEKLINGEAKRVP